MFLAIVRVENELKDRTHDELKQLYREVTSLIFQTVTEPADRLCWMDIYKQLAGYVGVEFDPLRLDPKQMRRNCDVFVDSIYSGKPYQEDECTRELVRLRRENERLSRPLDSDQAEQAMAWQRVVELLVQFGFAGGTVDQALDFTRTVVKAAKAELMLAIRDKDIELEKLRRLCRGAVLHAEQTCGATEAWTVLKTTLGCGSTTAQDLCASYGTSHSP